MGLFRLLVAVMLGVAGVASAHLMLPYDYALAMLVAAVLIGVGPLRLIGMLVGLFYIMRALS